MRSVFKRVLFVIAVSTILSTQGAFAAQRDDGDFGPRCIFQRVKQLIVHILGEGDLGWPKP
jgi:hypothetical protein